ncbi:hypothetical protein [Capnocytophaga catalasegens]|uniref:Riboflavin synthase subunit beta n=1 Tax=Capnocytophaga catalasegens TaxID=1004260 RepID=A0AAV5AYL6_9FLAO|nr:hypothetical protein [Capnocytophaga catalasegens]GIZ14566.1 hypothetical protein RCZ03_05670 [Capnocytophaga catalasegens]GJM50768.1 hypothetical protein RCZ15_17410 [Capnocytophaga catalasegens]GJM51921.1 hypothetical protein RCZ16_02390 [Capnocytophaga catalasegens]
MKIKGFKLDKNKRFNYTPRYYNSKDTGNPYKFEERIRKYRDTTNTTIGTQWQDIRNESRNRDNGEINRTLIIVFLILLLIAFYILDFDLSIFFKK